MPKKKRPLIVPLEYEDLACKGPTVNANILLHGYPGGIRSERVVPEKILADWGYEVDGTSIYDPVRHVEYSGVTLRDAIDDLSFDHPSARSLSRALGRDAEGECRDYIQNRGSKYGVHEYLYEELPNEYVEEQLEVSRLYRRLKGKPLNQMTKWSQSNDDGKLPFAFGYEKNKFRLDVEGDVYLAGRGGSLRQIEASIKTAGRLRVTDRREGQMPDAEPPEDYCIGNESSGSGEGMSNTEKFYPYYAGWRDQGKKVWFQARVFCPPTFPCIILDRTRPHNEEVICYTDSTIKEYPDWESEIAKIGRANVRRNRDTRDGVVEWPEFDAEMVEDLLCAPLNVKFHEPEKINLERKVCNKARFPIAKHEVRLRCEMDRPAYVHTGISASVMMYMLCCQQGKVNEFLSIDILKYPYFAAHQDVEECMWSFEATARSMGLKRTGNMLMGQYTLENKQVFLQFMEKHVGKF